MVSEGDGGDTVSGWEMESSLFTLRFSGVSISGVESTSKSELDDPKWLSVRRSGDRDPLRCFIGGLLGGGDSEQVSLLESLMMRARFDPGNKVIVVHQRALAWWAVGGQENCSTNHFIAHRVVNLNRMHLSLSSASLSDLNTRQLMVVVSG